MARAAADWYRGIPGGNIAMISDETSWVCAKPPRLRQEMPPTTVPPDGAQVPGTVDPFELGHRETAWFLATNRGLTRPYLGDDDAGYEAAMTPQIPMGYTSLAFVEKRAVVADGRLARVWPRRRGTGGVVLYLPPAGGEELLGISGGSVLWHGIRAAENLSNRMMGLPILLGVVYDSRYWH